MFSQILILVHSLSFFLCHGNDEIDCDTPAMPVA